jgi:hypothetical protein
MGDFNEDALSNMILEGLVEVAGIDEETGDFLYSFTDKLSDTYPEMARISEEMFLSDVNLLWEMGFVSMNIADANPLVTLTEKSFDRDLVSGLSPELRTVLNLLKNAMRI